MPSTSFQCPECLKSLRAKSRALVGKTIPCPGCGTKICLEADSEGSILARRAEQHQPSAENTSADSEFQFPPQSAQGAARTRMLIIGGCSALVFIVLWMLIFFGGEQGGDSEHEATAVATNDANPGLPEESEPKGKSLLAQLRDDQLSQQSNAIDDFLTGRGVYPSQSHDPSLNPEQSLSWIVSLEAQADPDRLPPLWDHAWNDPLNDHFVRRSLSGFLNPAIDQKASPDRYPATHFVGIAGVGRDAASLLKSDARAGMFGWNRSVSLADVPDGLANTWMISGVQENFGAWAAGGEATVRSVGEGPLLGGAEGFGIGDPHKMPILMADGSVRELSSTTDREVVRALATLNDRVGMRPENTAEKINPVLAENVPPLVAPLPELTDLENLLSQLQIELANEPEPDPVDVEQQLAQKLLSFDQPKELPLSTILSEFEEMVGVKIVTDKAQLGDYFSRLDRRLRISLTEPTLKEVLEKLLERGGLWYRIEEGTIIVTPAVTLSP